MSASTSQAWATLQKAIRKQRPSLTTQEVEAFAIFLVQELAKAIEAGKTPVFMEAVGGKQTDVGGGLVIQETTLRFKLPGGSLDKLIGE